MTPSPGPWTIDSDADTFEFDIKAGEFYVAAIPDVPGHTEANARLIAAAPETTSLLRDVGGAIAAHENGEYVDWSDWLIRIYDQLSRVEGYEP